MRTAKILRNFMHATDSKLSMQSKQIYTSILGNPNYLQPNPTMAVLLDVITAYQDALTAARGGQPFVAIKNAKKKELQAKLLKLSYYVTDAANGDRAKLESSGFTINAAEKSALVLGAVNNFTITQGAFSGSVIAKCDGVKNRVKYIFEYALAPAAGADTKWERLPSSDRKVTLMGLQSLKLYCFRVVAMGTGTQIAYSEIITKGVA